MKKNQFYLLGALAVVIAGTVDVQAQKSKLDRNMFEPAVKSSVAFVPYKKSDFTKDPKSSEDDLITLPNKKKIKLGDYIKTLNAVEGNLASIGFSKNRQQKTIIASRLKSAAIAPATATTGSVKPQANTMPKNAVIANRFIAEKSLTRQLRSDKLSNIIAAKRKTEIDALPNEKFDRTYDLAPPAFKNGEYAATLVASYYLKGENDPFFVEANQANNTALPTAMKETNSFYTAGMDVNVAASIPGFGTLSLYKLDAEFTARSNKTQKHSSKARLQVLQQVLINESQQNSSNDNYSYQETRLYPVSKLIGGADIFTYGLNAIMPVDFYLTSIGVGAGIDVDLTRTGISGSMGPRVAQSVILETSATELLGPGGELLTGIGDIGVGGELRLVQGGLDYGFTAGLTFNGNKLVFVDDMYAEIDLEFLRGRIFTFYEYLNYTCDNILGLLNLSCWETRRVENDLYNTGAAISFKKKVVDEDKSVQIRW